ncbi:ATP synthase F1 subunit epsilon [Candidatus Dojkabacteria bacterium]|uniref:ATP synthase epsilon chain n=1 Tax=Candidatus Dojkabacteria bacterium TaxID=2099670 RepID=A0A955L8C7_9BACT|nr:ATP synthase F1 subunit epsilon [Candidatus Dojkabacteria bacterium]
MITLKIVTPEGIISEISGVQSVTLPTETGVITIKEDHLPLISLLQPGEIEITNEKGTEILSVSTGMIEVREESMVYILADTAERAEDIDIERAEEARRKAEEFLEEKDILADVDFARLQAKMEKEMARIRVGRKYRKLAPPPQ